MLVLAADLIGFCLVRFAFHARFKKPTDNPTPSLPNGPPKTVEAKMSTGMNKRLLTSK
jgi:hypothetical protein